MNRPTLTICIPAFNEGENLAKLLESLINLNQTNCLLKQIIVFSDASDDDTDLIAARFSKQNVRLISSPVRVGQAIAQNQLISQVKTDYLILLNADIKITDRDFLNKSIKPFLDNPKIGLLSVLVEPLKGKTHVEKIINWSHLTKTKIFQVSNKPIYLCHGRARVISKAFYSQLVFPKLIAEDAYSYLMAKKLGFDFAYTSQTKIYFRSPANLKDHLLQSQRFAKGKIELEKFFDPEIVKSAYRLPKLQSLLGWTRALTRQPFLTLAFFWMSFLSLILAPLLARSIGSIWAQSQSSKKI